MIPQKVKTFLRKKDHKNVKIPKRSYAYKGYASTYNVDFLTSFHPEIEPRNTESAIKNKLVKLIVLTERV